MNQRSITEGLSRLVRIPALHAGGHGFESHSLHASHEFRYSVFLVDPPNHYNLIVLMCITGKDLALVLALNYSVLSSLISVNPALFIF